ncbi:ankyrin 3 [Fusarium pseudoanthophilum]|uniref:Ankyrin 3 n=1 Tax=Fusarium pseudoanthophilum TaxID=48495 RepID=A0A8H5PPF6_9HYPO|nr:ankyrin 3 [Fusarium pseudoanthophilum]
MSFYQPPNVDENDNQAPELAERSRLGSTGDSHDMATVEPSIQNSFIVGFELDTKMSRRDKRKKRSKKGYGDKVGSHDRAGEDSRKGIFDGLRYPQELNPPKRFPCPFYQYSPTRYYKCSSFRLHRLSDVSQHIARAHVLRDDVAESDPSITPAKICVYCTWCRQEFHGPGAERRLHDHTSTCDARKRPNTIEATGVLLPKELDDLSSALAMVMGNTAKWNVIWHKCFPETPPPPPNAEIAASQPEARRILQRLVSSSAAPWSTPEVRQSWIDGTLRAIYNGSPFSDTEPQVTDASTIPSTLCSDTSDSEESTFGDLDHDCFIAPESSVGSCDMGQWTRPLKIAIQHVDHDRVHVILRDSFDKVAVGEYSWLLELKALGLSADEIADELLERSQYGPWIYSKINVPDVGTYHHQFHIPDCLHSWKEDEEMPKVSSQSSEARMSLEGDSENSVRETIEYLCGIGGVSPMPDGSPSLQFGSVFFENAKSTSIVSLTNNELVRAVPDVLQNLEKAIGALQQVGGCCDSFTFLARQESVVELKRTDPQKASFLESLVPLVTSDDSLKGSHAQFLSSLTAQFLSLAFALYAQGHCEPFRPFFLDTSLKRILLIGNQIWGPTFSGPCILASPIELSCFGGMVQRRLFAFQYFKAFDRSKVFSDPDTKFDLKARPEDLLDTWGPGDFIVPKDDQENLHAISIGGGLITSASTEVESQQLPVLHWSRESGDKTEVTSTFPRHEKMVIGSRVSINQTCRITSQEQVRKSIPWLKELGTFPSYWEVSERQLGLGLQAGNGAVGTLNFAQTWVKRLGQTKKSNILAKRSLSIADLEGPFAVQVSFCTGIARRVQLRELLADILPVYVADLATQPCKWKRLQDCNICTILRDNDFRTRYQKLDRELQAEFETLAIAVLFLLQDTGVDRKGENFVVGCVPSGSAVQCFKIPIEKESFWARILADSEDVATFAYVATSCFETDRVRCRGPKEQWKNATALFSTAVSLCHDRIVAQGTVAQQTRWALKDSEAYLLGRVDGPLLVRVIRPNIQDEPELLVSMSTIIAPFLRRWSRKQGYKRPWRLRESRAIDHQHHMAESVVVTTDFENSW